MSLSDTLSESGSFYATIRFAPGGEPAGAVNGVVPGEGGSVWSIQRLNTVVRENLQGNPLLQNIWIEGEIFNLTYHSSGHIYFSLKDEASEIRCTFFRGANLKFRDVKLQNGMKILAGGGVSVFVQRGSYQFNVTRVMIAGEGELRLRIERLKKRLQEEGLFDPARKRPFPYLPLTIGVATAATGAAIRDIIRVARTRFPRINILLAPCLVQGEGSVSSIVEAIRALNDPRFGVDVIIAGRGGGSFEDLMSFNEEPVVRAFAESRVPILSAVGHEIDHPLSDLAADAFAPTPSAAVERLLPVYEDLRESLEDSGYRLRVALNSRHRREKERLLRIFKSRVHENPRSILEGAYQSLDMITRELQLSMVRHLKESRMALLNFNVLPGLYEKNLARNQRRFSVAAERLENFSPLGTLQRGYAVVRDQKGTVIRSANQVKVGESLEILLHEGRLEVKVEKSGGNKLES